MVTLSWITHGLNSSYIHTVLSLNVYYLNCMKKMNNWIALYQFILLPSNSDTDAMLPLHGYSVVIENNWRCQKSWGWSSLRWPSNIFKASSHLKKSLYKACSSHQIMHHIYACMSNVTKHAWMHQPRDSCRCAFCGKLNDYKHLCLVIVFILK